MIDAAIDPALKQRLMRALDWGVFMLGVVSLTTAIAATVAGTPSQVASHQAQPVAKTTQVLPG
ncbi:hypothetical protein AIOL_004564 [Candidatus Rhodobacter oscarellae]|uniref:Uncharacterized protein n=1 Tax=Candidatus Rhodobacter oscarellae TaxID=1675527 RepID=A0A0J9E9V8_9RHOB|nr:hypothetical protein [Candidatus Rhodobacter lobularis]KMW59582.1 hypothetical protein AIOL_004564 [Candidatus Rhodobacter lobularis]